jgi:hypothetical protein
MPASYLAQERPDRVVRGYLDSLGVRTIALESWTRICLLGQALACKPGTLKTDELDAALLESGTSRKEGTPTVLVHISRAK